MALVRFCQSLVLIACRIGLHLVLLPLLIIIISIISGANVLLDGQQQNIKLADFGISKVMTVSKFSVLSIVVWSSFCRLVYYRLIKFDCRVFRRLCLQFKIFPRSKISRGLLVRVVDTSLRDWDLAESLQYVLG